MHLYSIIKTANSNTTITELNNQALSDHAKEVFELNENTLAITIDTSTCFYSGFTQILVYSKTKEAALEIANLERTRFNLHEEACVLKN